MTGELNNKTPQINKTMEAAHFRSLKWQTPSTEDAPVNQS
jgi:hypothetical protein